jgi:glucose-6-phosphate isomerase
MVKLTDSKAWLALQQRANQVKSEHLRIDALFAEDPNRFAKYSLSHGQLLLDFSKQLISPDILDGLFKLAQESDLESAIKAMFRGDEINTTEKRAAAHTALRIPESKNQPTEVALALEQMDQFAATSGAELLIDQ